MKMHVNGLNGFERISFNCCINLLNLLNLLTIFGID